VLGVLSVDAIGLEVLVLALGGTLPVITFFVAATTVIVELALLVLAMLTMMVAAVALIVRPVAPMLMENKAYLTCILFLQLVA
jgi:hypothetical protein